MTFRFGVVTEFNINYIWKHDCNATIGSKFDNDLPDFETILISGFVHELRWQPMWVRIRARLFK